MHAYALIAASLACLVHAGGASAQQWEELGPAGGWIHEVAAGPAGSGKVYALAVSPGKGRLFASVDDGLHWMERPLPATCSHLVTLSSALPVLQVRADGDVFLHCNVPVMRSRDGARTWSAFTPGLLDGQLVFNTGLPARAALRRWIDIPSLVASTDDDALTWSVPNAKYGDFVPSLIAWDPLHNDRLLGISSSPYVGSPPAFHLRYYESHDYGVLWSPVAIIAPQPPSGQCYEREFVVDPVGRAYVIADCGFLRSLDGGKTWETTSGIPGAQATHLSVDPANADRLLVMAFGGLHESRDAATSWQPLPLMPSIATANYAASASGQLFAATIDGVFRLDAPNGSWSSRNTGLHGQPMVAVEPAGDASVVLLAIGGSSSAYPGNFRSLDGGQTWAAFSMDGYGATALTRNLTVPSSVFAMAGESAILASANGGVTWTLVNAYASTRPFDRIAGIVPIGPQPGVVYGLYETCVENPFLGCFWAAQGVAKSLDGGKTWFRPSGSVVGSILRVVVSPADPNTAMVETATGLNVTRDGGAHWALQSNAYARVVPDPGDPARWYAVDMARKITVTTDAGVHWTSLGDPPALSTTFDLLVDPHDTRRLYAVGTFGDVSVSTDRAATWQNIVAPSFTLTLSQYTARIGPEATTTIYAAAAQGAVKVAVAAAIAPVVVGAVEYYRQSLDHYFVTANGEEIARLDSGALAGWVRTGETFNVLLSTTSAPDASPVCRFYGKPEKGLDSHFYSASTVECQAVRDRFGEDWIFESPAVFNVYLPAPFDGACPARTVPVYRLYNNRADVNHRYTTSTTTRQQMIAAGWISEGYGANGVAMCVP